MNKLACLILIASLVAAVACSRPATVAPTTIPPTNTPQPSSTPVPSSTPTPTFPPKPTLTPTKTTLPAEEMEKLHMIYVIMYAIQLHVELAMEAASRVQAEEIPSELAMQIIREKGLSTENLDSSIEYLNLNKISVPEQVTADWEELLAAHVTTTDIVSRWTDKDITPEQVIEELDSVRSEVDAALESAEQELGGLIGQDGSTLTSSRHEMMPGQVQGAFPKEPSEGCPGESTSTASVNKRGRVAFISDRDGNAEIYSMNVDGSGVTRLTKNSAGDYNPA